MKREKGKAFLSRPFPHVGLPEYGLEAGGSAVIIGGMLNKNLLKFVARTEIREVGPEWLSPQAPNLVPEHKVVVGLLRHGQPQVADPEGNFPDVSE
jgi:hypothetical protein